MSRYRLRKATLRDLDVLVRHRRGMWEEIRGGSRELDAHDAVYRRWARQRLKTRTLIGWIVEDLTRRPVASGCIWLRPAQPFPEGGPNIVPYLLSMFTEPDHRGRGLATRIVREAKRWCRENGYRVLTLHASHRGYRVYTRTGFTRTREMRIRFPHAGTSTRRR